MKVKNKCRARGRRRRKGKARWEVTRTPVSGQRVHRRGRPLHGVPVSRQRKGVPAQAATRCGHDLSQTGQSRRPRPGRPPCCAVSRAAKPPRTQSRQGWGRRGRTGLTAWRVQAAASERRSRFGPRRRRRHSTANVLRAAESHAFKRPTSCDVNFAAIENFLTDGLNLGVREGITRRKEFREGRNGFGPTNACRPLTPRWPCAHCR